ncbi:hypothetical protein MHYP_G00361280 [Metynnis hypsauchen]
MSENERVCVDVHVQNKSCIDVKPQASNRDELQPYTDMHSTVTDSITGYDFVPLQEPQRDQRVRMLTEKDQELHDEQVRRTARRFSVCYKKWQEVAKKANQTLSGQCSTDLLNEHVAKVNNALRSLNAVYEELRHISVPDHDTRRRLDTCETVTQRIIKQAMDILDNINSQGRGDEERGDEETRSAKTSFSSHSTKASTHSRLTSASRKSAAAEVAANEATLQVLLEQERHIEELQRLEVEAAQLKAKQEAENAERQRMLEAKRRELERLETIKKLKAAKARQQVYEQSECSCRTSKQSQCSDDEINELLHQPVPGKVKREVKQEVSPLQHHSPPQAVTHPAEDNTAALIRALTQSISASHIPVPEPTMFNGDPLRYNDWKISFQTLIDQKNIPAEEKIYYLRKYVGGSAKKAIESYFLLGTESAYLAAWCILEERYGSPFLIAKAFRDKIDAWPKISAKGSLELQDFVDFLRSCESAMPQIRSLEVLNDCNENRKILAKLPDWLTSRWNRKVIEVVEESQTFPCFSQFVTFLTREAKIACNPITSLHALKPSEGEKNKGLKSRTFEAKALVMSSDEKANVTSCIFCEKVGHSLPECRKFIKKTITERVKFIQEKKLCFGCLKWGHRSKHCGDRNICKTCEKRHPTCLHDNRTNEERMQERTDGAKDHDKSKERKPDQPQDQVPSTSCEATSLRVTQNGRDTHTSTIIPVWVSATTEPNREVLVYALLDTQSDTTFILEETARALNTRSEPVQLRLSTLASRNTVVSCRKMTGLQVRGFYSDKIIPLPVTYSREFIPANRNHIPTPETAKVWSHLEHMADEIAPQQSCDVGLLIGYNCPQALIPRQVVPGEENQPFAQKTDLGWSVVGCGNPCLNYGDAIGVSHQVIVKQVMPGIQSSSDFTSEVHYVCRTQIKEVILPADVLKVLESDFAERASESSHVSQEDLRFLSKLKQGIILKSDGHYEMPLPFKNDRPNLPNNKVCAIHRLKCLERKLRRDEQYNKDYKTFMHETITRGDAERVPEEDLHKTPACFKAQHYELHHFSDASVSGYGACSYLRAVSESGEVHWSLVTGKARVAPTKVTTIPRLELSAAVVAVRTSDMLKKELEVECLQEFFWTDSMVVLGYINNEARRFHMFVANRVERIKQSTESTQWKYVASEENPADHASRGLTVEQLVSSDWFTGSRFLWQKELPSGEVNMGEISSSDPELKKVQVHDVQAKETKSLLDRLHKFSDWSRMVKAIARLKRQEIKGLQPRSCEVTSLEERREAELTIIKMVQEATFSKEIQCLLRHKETQVKDKKWIKDRRDARVNDVVLLQDDTTPRNQWKLAKVIEVYPGKDGRVRRLKLLISDSSLDEKGRRVSKPIHLERPIHKTVTLLEAD